MSSADDERMLLGSEIKLAFSGRVVKVRRASADRCADAYSASLPQGALDARRMCLG